jgi:DNA uptake protein ComE-like DNA-binding protein
MSSLPDRSSLIEEGARPLAPEGTRRVLAAAVFAAALAIGIANRSTAPSPGQENLRVPELRLDPNAAPPEVLAALPHVGPKLVREWVKVRSEGKLVSLEDAQSRVMGLGSATLDQIAPYLAFESTGREKPEMLAGLAADPPARKPKATRRRKSRAKIPVETAPPTQLVSRGFEPDDW